MVANVDKSKLHAIIEGLPQNQLGSVYEMLLKYLNDYADMHLTPEEYAAHMKALGEDEWYE